MLRVHNIEETSVRLDRIKKNVNVCWLYMSFTKIPSTWKYSQAYFAIITREKQREGEFLLQM